jgi:hypothetical protein
MCDTSDNVQYPLFRTVRAASCNTLISISLIFFICFVMLFHMSHFRLELESYTATAFNIHFRICLVLEGTVENPSGMVGKKAHNAIYTSRMHCIVLSVLWVSMWPRRTTCEERIYSCWTARMVVTPHSLYKQMQIRTSNLRVLMSGTLHTAPHGSVLKLCEINKRLSSVWTDWD